ncbi:MAG: hypothetical protein RIB67_08190 [Miltoncostaeaceae bacterium]
MKALLRPLVLALMGLALLVATAACGGGDDAGGPDLTADLAPGEILDRSAQAMRDARSFRLGFEVTGTAAIGGQVGTLLGDEIDISGEGPVLPPDGISLDVSVAVSGLPLQGNLSRSGDVVALSVLGRDVGIDLDAATLEFLDFGAAYPELAGWITDPATTEGDSRDGVGTVDVSGALDPQRALAGLAPLLGADAGEGSAGRITGTASVSVGRSDLLARRVEARIQAPAGALGADSGPADITIVADLSGYGAQEPVVLPPLDRRLAPSELGSLLGG